MHDRDDNRFAAGLVREGVEPDERDCRAVFTSHQLLVVTFAGVGTLLLPQLSALLAPDGGLGMLLPSLPAALTVTVTRLWSEPVTLIDLAGLLAVALVAYSAALLALAPQRVAVAFAWARSNWRFRVAA